MRTLTEIKTLLQSHKKELFARYPLTSLAIYGSYARGEQTEASDLDILVDFSEPIGMELVDLALELEKIIDLRVDILYPRPDGRLLSYIKNDLIYV